ncbi:lysophospholipase catalytic domain-containing protein [Melampsora americana]|nr:lysophospholipase catalytic domain-containing protein [Melampsora americana]
MFLEWQNQKLQTQFILIVSYAIITKSVQGLVRRAGAIENSPTDGYAPVFVTCPANFTVRQPSGKGCVSERESKYVNEKTSKSNPVWRSYLTRAQLDDFDLESFLPSDPIPGQTLPNIGLAISGGGIRALLGCAGVLNAFDDRNEQANLAGTGGILQLSNYITGLSGGSWLIGSWATSDFPTFTSLNESIWNLTEKNSYASWNSIKRYPKAIKQAELKSKAGFPSSLADVQAYILSHHLINDTHHGTKVLFSSIRNTTGYKNYTAPFPILLSTSRHEGKSTIDLNTTIYEFSPEEFGVNHPSLNAYIPIDYLGSHMNSGKPVSTESCALGFDNAGWVIGASSNVLSQPGVSGSLLSSWQTLETKAYDTMTRNIYDEAIVPNPFYKLQKDNSSFKYEDQNEKHLYLADGGWGGEIVPFWPLLQPDRKLDVIIAVDYVADGPSMYHGACE